MKRLLILFLLLISTATAADFTPSVSSVPITIADGSSGNFTFSVSKNETQGIDFDPSVVGLVLNSSIVSTSASGTTQNFLVNVDVPKHFLPGIYKGKIKLQSNESVRWVDVTVTVPERRELTYLSNNTNFDIFAGQNNYIYLPIKNSGNSIVHLSAMSNNHLFVARNQTLQPGEETNFSLPYTTANIIGTGNTTISLSNLLNLTFNYTIKDITPPTIVYYEHDPIKAMKDFDFKIVALDNVNVTRVVVNGFNLTKDGDIYSGKVRIENVTTDKLNIVVYDVGGNNITRTENISISRLGGFEFFEDKSSQVRKGTRATKNFLNITEDFEFEVKRVHSKMFINSTIEQNATSFRIIVKTPTGDEREITDNANKLKGVGVYQLILIHDIEGEYHHTISITVPDYVSATPVHEKSYTQNVRDYTLIEKEEDWVQIGARKSFVSCHQEDRGSLEDSVTVCSNFTYPANTRINELSVVTSKAAQDSQVQLMNERLAGKDEIIAKKSTMVNGLVAVMIVSFLAGFFMFKIKGKVIYLHNVRR